mgnify:CR=1 FL=1|tara:strand:+ start:13786 stop:14220 length:435 start_codon:yes stop_codon:yes gene_type:complete
MILIAHRGNIAGPVPKLENRPEYLSLAIGSGYSVEADVWYHDGQIFLGHDEPSYPISLQFLQNEAIWCHCKNVEAARLLIDNDIHCFYHNIDDITITSRGYIWTYPNKKLVERSVCVMPELGYSGIIENCSAICSDYIEKYKDL